MSFTPLSVLQDDILQVVSTVPGKPLGSWEWIRKPTLTTLERRGYLRPEGDGWALTELGERARFIAYAHKPTIYTRSLGSSRIKGGGRITGTGLRCSCGKRFETNTARAKGGERDVKARHQAHLAEEFGEVPTV